MPSPTSAACARARRREVKARQAADHLPEAFFGKRPLEVVGAQARFDVGDRNAVVERGQRTQECALGIALDDDGRPRLPRHHRIELLAAADAELRERAALRGAATMSGTMSKQDRICCAISPCWPVWSHCTRAPRRASQRRDRAGRA